MYSVNIRCFQCNKEFIKPIRRYNEAIKRNWNQYCSPDCIKLSKKKGKKTICDNPFCSQELYKTKNQLRKTIRDFCSRSCSATLHNIERGLRNRKKCQNPKCSLEKTTRNKYCSKNCQQALNKLPKKVYAKRVIKHIKRFVNKNNRIPFKQEVYYLYRPARIAFGTWNQAIKASGFKPNKVKFTKKFIANDGHKCDSLAEKIIDDWLFSRKIKHKVNYPYPGNRFTVDFKVKNYWIEFFGLSGQLVKYDQLKQEKLNLIKNKNLSLISIYPKDLFPKSKLDQILSHL